MTAKLWPERAHPGRGESIAHAIRATSGTWVPRREAESQGAAAIEHESRSARLSHGMSDDQPDPRAPRAPRPLIERLGLTAVALVLAVLFGGVAAASWIGGEPFLAIMAAIGSAMTLWVGAITLRG